MQPRIEHLNTKKLLGKRISMSLASNKTRELWQSFMPRLREITHRVGSEFYSVEVYDPLYFVNFNPRALFDKWAAIEVNDFSFIPEEMESLTLPAGLYAVFLHKGPASAAAKTYQYIYGTWLPSSSYLLDNRPHFAKMGEKYKNEGPTSEEEIWIPIKLKVGESR